MGLELRILGQFTDLKIAPWKRPEQKVRVVQQPGKGRYRHRIFRNEVQIGVLGMVTKENIAGGEYFIRLEGMQPEEKILKEIGEVLESSVLPGVLISDFSG